MSWMLNQGPSFNVETPKPYQLSGFGERFMLKQDDPRMTPGKPEPHLPAETMKGTFALKKSSRKKKHVKCKDLGGIPGKKLPTSYKPFGHQWPEPKKRKRKK